MIKLQLKRKGLPPEHREVATEPQLIELMQRCLNDPRSREILVTLNPPTHH
jgi:hypothetical protein